MDKLKDVLLYLEEHDNLNEAHQFAVTEKHKRSLRFEEVDRIPLAIFFPQSQFTGYPYAEAFLDPEKMMINELLLVCGYIEILQDTMTGIRANYGVGILPSLFGVNSRVVDNNMPWVDCLKTTDDIREVVSRGMPGFRKGLGLSVLQTHEYYLEQLAKYPKCSRLIKISCPDLQGPFDVAHLLWGHDIYYALYDQPELVHSLLRLITETYIQFLQELRKSITDVTDDFIYQGGMLFRGRTVIKDDTAVNMSNELYEEFVKPYDRMILQAVGGGSIHYCGQVRHFLPSMMGTDGLQGINFGKPPNTDFGLEFLQAVYPEAKKRGIALVNYNADQTAIESILNSDIRTGVTLSTRVNTRSEATSLFRSVGLA
jgi:hypothetical protein